MTQDPYPRTPDEVRDDDAQDDAPTGCQPPLWLVGLALVVLVFAGIFSVQLLNVVYGLVFPPSAPRPAGLIELAHQSEGARADRWHYQSDLTPCEVVAFYEAEGGICRFDDGGCEADGTYRRPTFRVEHFAVCEHVFPFSIFGLRWRVHIEPDYRTNPTETRFELFSEVLWGGMPPEPTPTP